LNYFLGNFIISTIRLFDFSAETLFKINKNYNDYIMKMNPSYFSKICTTTSLFSFLLKDAFEYSGLIFIEKKSQLSIVYNKYLYFIETFEIKLTQLNKIKDKLG
jgi:hypothetical protein